MNIRVFVLALCVLPAVVLAWNQGCISKPVGFGYKTVGGAGGKTVKPKNINELKTFLMSKGKLIIDLTTTFDFTNSEGSQTTTGCYFQQCGKGFQESLAQQGTCDGKSKTTVSFTKAGLTELSVSSDKTVMSSNGKGVLKGKGLRVKDAKQVIIRDITITDINPEVIWAGDAIAFDNVENVWVHRVTTRRIGRQHLVSYQKTNKGITVSSCFFDGTSSHAAYCDGMHFWMWLFWGTHDEITLINNRVLNTAGRTPHCGGWAKSQNFVHMIYNTMEINPHKGIEPYSGAVVLAEGNLFNKFTSPVNYESKGGSVALINDNKQAQACKKYLGADCVINKFSGGSKVQTYFNEAVLKQFATLDKQAITSARNAKCL